jgi:predicted NBD/HSP70 family sugar kinase
MNPALQVSQERIRDANYRQILHVLMRRREMSKQEMAKETGLSVPTVTVCVARMLQQGVAEEAGVSVSTGGRKPMLIRFLPHSRFAFGVDFSSNHLTSSNKIRVILIDFDVKIRKEVSFDYEDYSTIDEIMHHVSGITERIVEELQIPLDRILGIGFSLPGTVNERRKVLEFAPNISPDLEMNNLHFKRYESLFPFPLFVENEANAAAFAELLYGVAKRQRNLVYLSVNRGIGAGIVIRGHVYKGNKKRAGEIGHITVDTKGIRCTCGRKDCWEIYAASGALIRNYNEESDKNLKDSKEFLQVLESSDPLALKVWDTYLDHLVTGINNVILCFDPHYIVIGGEISEFGESLLDPLKTRLFLQNPYYKNSDLQILISSFGENASVIGVALLPFQKLYYGENKII